MHQRLDTIMCEVTARVSSGKKMPVPLPAELHYRSTDPYAVQLSLGSSASQPVTWFLARNLLSEGMRRPTGAGDVLVIAKFCHRPHRIRIILSNPAGTALVELELREVAAFLERTFIRVPAGAESAHLDIDGVITKLLGGDE